jgi:hypothetical protein
VGAFSRPDRPELSCSLTLADEAEGAGNVGCQHAPMGPEQQKAREVGPQVRPGGPGVPRAVGLRFIRALPGETWLVCHRLHWTRLRLVKRHLPLGRQACTISPSAMRRARLARFSRPPHPAPNVRDDRDTPLRGGGTRSCNAELGSRGRGIFSQRGLDKVCRFEIAGKIRVLAQGVAAVEQAPRHRLDAAGWLPACTALQCPAPKARAVHSPRGRQLPGPGRVAPTPFKRSQSISFAVFTSAPSSRAPRA